MRRGSCAWFLLGWLLGCAHLPIVEAVASRPWPTTAPYHALTLIVNESDGYLVGTVAKAEPVWLYDDICGGIASLLGRCNGTSAYQLTIRSTQPPMPLYVFVPHGDTLVLPVGTQAVFIWKLKWIRQLQVCEQRRRVGLPYVCESDRLAVMESLDAIVNPADSALVADLFATR